MKKFSFRLEPVLQQRIMSEEKAILDHAEAYREYSEQVQLLDETRADLDRVLRDISDTNMDSVDILNINLYVDFAVDQINARQAGANHAWQLLEIKRQALVDARKERLVLEQLKKNQYSAFMENINSMEQKALDEIGTMQATRRKG